MAITQVITPLPPAPARTDPPAVFVPKADAHVASLDQLVTEENTFAAQVNATQVEINNTAVLVGVLADSAAVSANASAASAADSSDSAALAASAASFKGTWASLTGALSKPSSVLHNGTYWQLLNDLADVTASEPTTASNDWASTPQPLKVAPRTAAAQLTVELPNELQDGSAFPLPLANSVTANTSIEIEQPLFFEAFKPSVIRSGSDSINGDTTIEFTSPTAIKLTSNGVDTWRI